MSTKEFGLSYFFASRKITDFLWMQQHQILLAGFGALQHFLSDHLLESIKGHHPFTL
jgi:hypothetical protein